MVGVFRLCDAAILVVTVDNAVQLVTCHIAGAVTSTLQVRDKGGQIVEGLAAAAAQFERLGLVSGGVLVTPVAFNSDKTPIAVLAPKVGAFNLSNLPLGICRLQEPRLLVSLDFHVAEDAFVVRISAHMLYEILEARKGHLVIGTVAVLRVGLVFHTVD